MVQQTRCIEFAYADAAALVCQSRRDRPVKSWQFGRPGLAINLVLRQSKQVSNTDARVILHGQLFGFGASQAHHSGGNWTGRCSRLTDRARQWHSTLGRKRSPQDYSCVRHRHPAQAFG